MAMRVTGSAHSHQEWGCASPVMLTLTGNAHSLYGVILTVLRWFKLLWKGLEKRDLYINEYV